MWVEEDKAVYMSDWTDKLLDFESLLNAICCGWDDDIAHIGTILKAWPRCDVLGRCYNFWEVNLRGKFLGDLRCISWGKFAYDIWQFSRFPLSSHRNFMWCFLFSLPDSALIFFYMSFCVDKNITHHLHWISN